MTLLRGGGLASRSFVGGNVRRQNPRSKNENHSSRNMASAFHRLPVGNMDLNDIMFANDSIDSFAKFTFERV